MDFILGRPAKETLTEKNLPDQTGKVFIVTGASAGVGKELVDILFAHNAKVYAAARSAEKTAKVIEAVKSKHPESKGELDFLSLDLSDLSGIKASATEFLGKERRLDVLWNNAGVMAPPRGSKSKQGYELQLGTNNVGHFLFTKLLIPVLQETAKTAPSESVRVVWVSSTAAGKFSPHGGVALDNLDYKSDKGPFEKYGVTKAGNILQGKEFATRYGKDGIISVSCDPGNLNTGLYQHIPGWQKAILDLVVLKPAIYGAYTELYCGFSSDIKAENNGTFVVPWGKISRARKDIEASARSKEDGGTGVASAFWEWCEEQVRPFL